MNTRNIGFAGEDVAVRYLSKHGYKILERNYRASHGEIDIIAKHKDYYVFVEVKCRTSVQFGLPREAVTARKQQTIIQCAKVWLVQNRLYGVPVRFDVVEILNDEISVITDAYRM
ncbi:MAG: YraN family protein [Corallococcus sp.]|nr:YraN family protein [Corallococcus sp.]MCM1359475.1 YraN family protein [Corallococcus sp.]MCM1394713.1 YraN family protein [Corallococcus sp.]